MLEMNRSISLSLPNRLVDLIGKVGAKRQDPTRSDTVRVLLLQALAQLNYLPEDEKKALGVKNEHPRET